MKQEWTIWWWQFGCSDAWTLEFTDNFGWSVKIKPLQEELPVCKCGGLFINWETPFADVNKSNFSPSEVLISSDHQHDVLALKSPVITDKCSKVSQHFIEMNQIHYYFGWENGKLRTLSPFYYYNSFLKVMLL